MRRHRATGGVQMFSFLDAMVCTMGALLVLVHAFARHGQEQIIKSPELKAARENLEATKAEIESLEWRATQLQEVRDKTQAQLNDERLKLSHVEDHERRLLARLDELKVSAEQMVRLDAADRTEQSAADLAMVRARLRDARDELAAARKAAQEGAVNYSVVPYEGVSATHRRPIYIECRREAIVLQPEEIELTEADFAGYFGPGNPLAAAIRGMREYWARQAPGGTPKTEPYPLLLVRPEGIKAYYAARASLDSWGSDFGYELVGSDWHLKFPERDEQLAQQTREIVADAAVRARALVISLAQLSKNRPRAALHASPHGGFVVDRSHRGGEGPAGGGPGGASSDSITSNWGSDGNGSNANEENGGRYGEGAGDRSRAGNSFGETGTPGGDDGSGANRYGTKGSEQFAGTDGRTDGKRSATDEAGGRYGGGSTRGSTQGQRGAAGQLTDATNGGTAGGTLSQSSSSGSSGSAQSMDGSGTPSPTINVQSSKKTTSLAKSRGRDWGLPDGGHGAAAATRPILVECHNDRLVLLSEDRGHPPKEIRLGHNAQDSMDEFVGHVWEHMKSWGTAGKGLYWKPTLLMDVEPGAADRYAEVKSLLSDSGLDVEERRPKTAQQPASTSPRSFRSR